MKHATIFGKILRSIHLAAVFCALSSVAARAAEPCSTGSENRKLDYWLGDWVVTGPGSPNQTSSKVYLELGNCVVVESWDNGKGHAGQNMFAYSADDKLWRGIFADNEGRVHVFVSGKVAPGSAEFDGPSRGPDGQIVLNRLKIFRLTPNKVEQTWEKSSDNGATWTTVFRGDYARKSR